LAIPLEGNKFLLEYNTAQILYKGLVDDLRKKKMSIEEWTLVMLMPRFEAVLDLKGKPCEIGMIGSYDILLDDKEHFIVVDLSNLVACHGSHCYLEETTPGVYQLYSKKAGKPRDRISTLRMEVEPDGKFRIIEESEPKLNLRISPRSLILIVWSILFILIAVMTILFKVCPILYRKYTSPRKEKGDASTAPDKSANQV
jgi:hypothetical protein